jgi:hypothetical protein
MVPSAAITFEWFQANKNNDGKVTFEFCGIDVTCQATVGGEKLLSCDPPFPFKECCDEVFSGGSVTDCNDLDAAHEFVNGVPSGKLTMGGPAETHVIRFSEDQNYWHKWFRYAWQ